MVIAVLAIAAAATIELTRSGTTTTSATRVGPTTLSWDTNTTPYNLDTNLGNAGAGVDIVISENTNEQLLWYNGTCGTCVIPWLAENYTHSADYKTWTFTLRQGIKFQDGEVLNSSAVYFSFNRDLVDDGSAYLGYGVGVTWEIQQFLNKSLSSALCGCAQDYGATYVKDVLAENFVQITGPYTFTLNFQTGFTGIPFLLAAANIGDIVAPSWTMTHDVAFWQVPGKGYTLPYTSLSGNSPQQYTEYYDDLMATCGTGATPAGCGSSYQDVSPSPGDAGYNGPVLSGTGPYEIAGWDQTTDVVTLQANSNYWGGNWVNPIKPYFQTITIKYTPDDKTRDLDLTSAASSGQPYAIDTDLANVQDIINSNAWLDNHTMTSVIPGVTINGPNAISQVDFFNIVDNNTNPYSGKLLTFQPWADLRFREAVADSANITAIDQADDLGLSDLVDSVVSPAYGPSGAYSNSTTLGYSYNPDESAKLLLQMMQSPITTFHFYNGTLAPPGLFNNTFGCAALNSNNQCSDPVTQTVQLTADPTKAYDYAIVSAEVEALNNISFTYNLGLNFEVNSQSLSNYMTQEFAPLGSVAYSSAGGWAMFYPYVLDVLGGTASITAAGFLPNDRDNVTAVNTLYDQAFVDATNGNSTGFLSVTHAIEQALNNEVWYVIEGEPEYITATTSNVHGYFFNPSLFTDGAGSGTMYFAVWYST